MRQRWWILVIVVGVSAVLVVLALTLAAPAPPPVVTPAATPIQLTTPERAFYDRLGPPLRAAVAEADALTALGEERSRNIFAIRAGQDRLEAHLVDIEAALAADGVPARFFKVQAAYRPAAADIRTAIRQAEAAFLRFDWDAVGDATRLMARGTGRLDATVAALDAAAGLSPAAATPAKSTAP